MSPTSEVVSLSGVSKSFGGKTVLHGVDLELASGSVVALLGANGAGKSTLIKILSGVHPDHGGAIAIDGQPVVIDSPATARKIGIQTVHQHIADGIFDGLTVAENLAFDDLANRSGGVLRNSSQMVARATEIAATLNLPWGKDILSHEVGVLGVSDRQLLILARALVTKPKLLILDEPTSALSDAEARRLFSIVERMRASGIAILYVSHRLGEIDELADRMVVLRDGGIVDTLARPFAWDRALSAMLAGSHEHVKRQTENANQATEVALSLRDVRLLPDRATLDVDFKAGEITGIVGLLGAGKSELAQGIFGDEPFEDGELTLRGEKFAPRRPADAISRGVHLVPEDRHAQALISDWSVSHNISLPFLNSFSRFGLLKRKSERQQAVDTIEALGIVTKDETSRIDELSGGNQQKVVVGRWLVRTPRVLILDEPFRGVDIGARRDIGAKLRGLTDQGGAVIVLSADVDEIFEVADRIVVLADGAIQLDEPAADVDRDAIIAAISAAASKGSKEIL